MAVLKPLVSIILLGVFVGFGTCQRNGGSGPGGRQGWPKPECRQKPEKCPEGLEWVSDFENSDEVMAFDQGVPILFCAHGCCGEFWRPNCCAAPDASSNADKESMFDHHQDNHGPWLDENVDQGRDENHDSSMDENHGSWKDENHGSSMDENHGPWKDENHGSWMDENRNHEPCEDENCFHGEQEHHHGGGHHGHEVLVPVLLSAAALVGIIVVTFCLIRRKKGTRQPGTGTMINTDSKGPVTSGKEPLPEYPGDSKMPGPIFVSGVPPPAYDVVKASGEDGSAPPSYSSLDLQEAARDSVQTPLDTDKEGSIA